MRSRLRGKHWIGTAAALLVALPLSAQAATIHIDANGYSGHYGLYVAGGSQLADYASGNASPDLADGSYMIKAGRYDAALIFFSVSGGQVNVPSDYEDSATATGNTLTFNTATVAIEPGSYSGSYLPYWPTPIPAVSGFGQYTLVKGLQYQVGIGGRGQGQEIVFSVDSNGNVGSVTPSVSGSPSGSTLHLNSREVLIEPVDFSGTYQFYWEHPYPGPTHTGPTTQYIVVDLPFFIGVGGLGVGNDARFVIPASSQLVQTVSTPGQQTLRISVPVVPPDNTPPVITTPSNLTVEATSAAGATVKFAVSALDDRDGSVAVTCSAASGSVFPLGTTTVTCSAEDAAGNTASGSFTVAVAYSRSGVLPPIDPDGSSVFRLGSTVPVKFQLTGDSAGISDAVARLSYGKVSDDVVGNVNVAESTSSATTGNLFRYDAASNEYIFNWSTKDLTAGTYQLAIDLGDGVARTVRLGLR